MVSVAGVELVVMLRHGLKRRAGKELRSWNWIRQMFQGHGSRSRFKLTLMNEMVWMKTDRIDPALDVKLTFVFGADVGRVAELGEGEEANE